MGGRGKKSRTKATGMKHRKPIERINANIVARLRIHVPVHTHARTLAHTHTHMWDAPISLRVRLGHVEGAVGGGSVKAGIIMRTHETMATTTTTAPLPCSSHNYEGNNFYLLGACFRQNEIESSPVNGERREALPVESCVALFRGGFCFFFHSFPFR